MNNKLDLILEQFDISKKKYDDQMSIYYSRIERRLNQIEGNIEKNYQSVSQKVEETESTMLADLKQLKDDVNVLKSEIHDLDGRFDAVDFSLSLLLLNSVMDQVTGE